MFDSFNSFTVNDTTTGNFLVFLFYFFISMFVFYEVSPVEQKVDGIIYCVNGNMT